MALPSNPDQQTAFNKAFQPSYFDPSTWEWDDASQSMIPKDRSQGLSWGKGGFPVQGMVAPAPPVGGVAGPPAGAVQGLQQAGPGGATSTPQPKAPPPAAALSQQPPSATSGQPSGVNPNAPNPEAIRALQQYFTGMPPTPLKRPGPPAIPVLPGYEGGR